MKIIELIVIIKNLIYIYIYKTQIQILYAYHQKIIMSKSLLIILISQFACIIFTYSTVFIRKI